MTHSDNSTTPIKGKHCKSMYEVIGMHVTCMGKNNDEVVCCDILWQIQYCFCL